jgi:hypothetical protein
MSAHLSRPRLFQRGVASTSHASRGVGLDRCALIGKSVCGRGLPHPEASKFVQNLQVCSKFPPLFPQQTSVIYLIVNKLLSLSLSPLRRLGWRSSNSFAKSWKACVCLLLQYLWRSSNSSPGGTNFEIWVYAYQQFGLPNFVMKYGSHDQKFGVCVSVLISSSSLRTSSAFYE